MNKLNKKYTKNHIKNFVSESVYDYLYFIYSISINDLSLQALYGLDRRRVELHCKMIKETSGINVSDYSDSYYRSKIITDRLDQFFYDYNPNKLPKINEMRRFQKFIESTEFKYFITNKTNKIHLNSVLLDENGNLIK